jgi:hypothetical protein
LKPVRSLHAQEGTESALAHRRPDGKGGHKFCEGRAVTAAGITTGTLCRSINKAGRIWGNGFSPKVIWGVVKDKAKACEIPSLAAQTWPLEFAG